MSELVMGAVNQPGARLCIAEGPWPLLSLGRVVQQVTHGGIFSRGMRLAMPLGFLCLSLLENHVRISNGGGQSAGCKTLHR